MLDLLEGQVKIFLASSAVGSVQRLPRHVLVVVEGECTHDSLLLELRIFPWSGLRFNGAALNMRNALNTLV